MQVVVRFCFLFFASIFSSAFLFLALLSSASTGFSAAFSCDYILFPSAFLSFLFYVLLIIFFILLSSVIFFIIGFILFVLVSYLTRGSCAAVVLLSESKYQFIMTNAIIMMGMSVNNAKITLIIHLLDFFFGFRFFLCNSARVLLTASVHSSNSIFCRCSSNSDL